MVPIKQNLVSSSKYSLKCPYNMKPEGITVHNTANNAPAKNEVAYMIRNDSSTSFHYAVDDVEIIQGIPENRNAHHASNDKGNRTTIGIEICYSTGDKSKFEKAQENAAEFIASKLKEYGWGTDRIYTHEYWYPKKHCPHRTLDEYGWNYFIGLVNKYLNGGSDVVTKTTVSNIDITYQTWDDVKNKWLPNVVSDSDYAGIFGNDVCAVYVNLAEGDCVYKVHTQEGKWLPEVKNREDYAGVFNKPIDGFMIKASDPNVQIYYQVHIRGGNWLPYVTGYDTSDSNNGYAGIIGKPIDGIRMYAKKTTIATTPAPQPVVVPTPTPNLEPEVQKIYRVRKSWEDASSQKGAYTSLEGAIECCQKAGEGYKVFDWNDKEVYAYIAPKIETIPVQDTSPEVDSSSNPIEVPIEDNSTKEDIETRVEEVTQEEPKVEEIETKQEEVLEPEINIETQETEPNKAQDNIEQNKQIDSIVNIIIKVLEVLFKKLCDLFLKK